MNTIQKCEEVELIYKEVDGFHFFIGNDHWCEGLLVIGGNYERSKETAMENLRDLLRINHGVRLGEWEIVE